ncbi:MAG TPA: methyltransferase domain-containing protein [Bradyrhizobium sp.]|nr:methyltransferase domain-containing protein [Bradyrhizobium sp.]
MAEVNLLSGLPARKRNVRMRATAKTEEHIRISREYGEIYFDGPREYGYGGYRYDGRWIPVAHDFIRHFSLSPGDRVLDVGCAKGFLVKDLMIACPGLEAFGVDVSRYALRHCEPETIGRLHLGNAMELPFPDNCFKAAISLNTVHNLDRTDCIRALKELQRVSGGRAFVQVDSYRTPEQKEIFEDWVLTARFHDYPEGWIALFREAGYTGDYYWTIIE